MNHLLRFSVLACICGLAAFLVFLPVGRILVALGYMETHSVFSVLQFSGCVGLFGGVLACMIYRE
jgi:hypothetical protein